MIGLFIQTIDMEIGLTLAEWMYVGKHSLPPALAGSYIENEAGSKRVKSPDA